MIADTDCRLHRRRNAFGGDLLLACNQIPLVVFDHPEKHVEAMNYSGRIAICLAVGLVLQMNANALTLEGSPYAAIVKRNVFRLTTPPPVEQDVPEVPPPKITLLGIVSGFGPKQVMFKILTGTPPRENSYALGEMEHADEIEVIEIMESAGLVRVKNHAREQTLSLEKDGLKPGSLSPVAASAAMTRASPLGGGRLAGPNQPQQPAMTAEEQMVLIEINRKLTAGQVEKGLMPPLPPTSINGN